MGIRYRHELITPDRARQLLAANIENNRNPKTSTKIAQYARDMASGNWQANTGETVKIDMNGKMLDGQNRMHAVILADTPAYFDIAYDVPTQAMSVIDTGAARTASDTLKIAGVTDTARCAAIVRWAIMWDAKNYMARGTTGTAPSNSEVLSRITSSEEERGSFDAAARRANDCSRFLRVGAPSGMAYYLFRRLDKLAADDFFDQLISGANLPEKSPILALRNRCARMRMDRTTRQEQLALFIRAWNFYRKDEKVTFLLIARFKLTNETFPQPK